MKKLMIPALLILTLALGLFSGRLTAPVPEPAPIQTTVPSTTTPLIQATEAPAEPLPIDAHFAKSPLDARTLRILWEYELREVSERYRRFTAPDDIARDLDRDLRLLAFLSFAATRAEVDVRHSVQPDLDTALAALYRTEAIALHEALAQAGHPVNYRPLTQLPDSDMLAKWAVDWAYSDRYNSLMLLDFPLVGAWPKHELRLWYLTGTEHSVLDVNGNRIVLPLDHPGPLYPDPQALRADLNNDGIEEIAIVSSLGHGTGAADAALHIIEYDPEGRPRFGTLHIFRNEDFAAMVAPHLAMTVEDGDILVTAFGDTVRVPAFEDAEPFTEAEPELEWWVSIDITEEGRIGLLLGIGASTNLSYAEPIFIANLTAELGWNGETIYLINPTLTETP